mgnify:CR=1 FL=1
MRVPGARGACLSMKRGRSMYVPECKAPQIWYYDGSVETGTASEMHTKFRDNKNVFVMRLYLFGGEVQWIYRDEQSRSINMTIYHNG